VEVIVMKAGKHLIPAAEYVLFVALMMPTVFLVAVAAVVIRIV